MLPITIQNTKYAYANVSLILNMGTYPISLPFLASNMTAAQPSVVMISNRVPSADPIESKLFRSLNHSPPLFKQLYLEWMSLIS